MPELMAEEIVQACKIYYIDLKDRIEIQNSTIQEAPVDTATEPCADIVLAKEKCLAEVSESDYFQRCEIIFVFLREEIAQNL